MDLLALLGSSVPVAVLRKAVGTWVKGQQFGVVIAVICCVSGYPEGDLVPLGRHHRTASVVWYDGGSLTASGFLFVGLSLEVTQDCIFDRFHHGGALALTA
jgi:hypothetical protein